MELPNLVEIKSLAVNGIKQNEFTLTVSLKVQKAEEAPAKNKIKGAQS